MITGLFKLPALQLYNTGNRSNRHFREVFSLPLCICDYVCVVCVFYFLFFFLTQTMQSIATGPFTIVQMQIACSRIAKAQCCRLHTHSPQVQILCIYLFYAGSMYYLCPFSYFLPMPGCRYFNIYVSLCTSHRTSIAWAFKFTEDQ